VGLTWVMVGSGVLTTEFTSRWLDEVCP